MLVYGDRSDVADAGEFLHAISHQLGSLARMPRGIERHAVLVRTLVETGQLVQALEDLDARSAQLSAFLDALALCVVRSFDTQFQAVGPLPEVPSHRLPDRIELRWPEGFAFYSLYPEDYISAARRLRLEGPARVIGIRSIGTTLGAVVAAAIGARPAITVRPFGDPFAREVELPEETIEQDAHYVIVDEGPGLSGSSFGAVADWLQARGVPLGRIAFLASHSGDLGREASNAHRERWGKAQRAAATFDPAFLERIFGPLEPLNIGGPWQRTKFLASKANSRLLLKFAGLGAIGERKLALARTLHAAGFVPEPKGLVHGFLVEDWLEEARPIASGERPIEHFGRYVSARAHLLAVPDGRGASIGELLSMCRRNIGLGLGRHAVAPLDRFDACRLNAQVRPIRTDNQVDPKKWLRLPDKRLLKTDALDHHEAHDLVGCQSVEWDVAGLREEFGLDALEEERLVQASAVPVDRDLLDFYRIAYSAFRLGQADLAGDPDSVGRYSRSLKHLLHQDS